MKTVLSGILAALFLFLIFLWGGGVLAAETNYTDCMGCHQGIEKISDNHNFSCAACHLAPKDRTVDPLTSHDRVIRNPSDPVHVRRFCMPCHHQEIQQLEKSLHSTMAGIINQTRYLWGAQASAERPLYGTGGVLPSVPVPEASAYPDSPGELVDDFLRRRCLRCHIHAEGPSARGLHRATGCAACHVIYGDEGRYGGSDAAIGPGRKGYPLRHRFTTSIPTSQCLHCHNHNHVGTDYVGLFERDYSTTYRHPNGAGSGGRFRYGLDHHRLARDIHAEKGMWCVDCHGKAEVMGNGRIYGFQMAVPKRVCSDCHGGFDRSVPDESISAVRRVDVPGVREGCDQRKWEFVSKNQGQIHELPLFSTRGVAHGVLEHKRLRCSGCHAQWSYQDYAMSVIRMDGRLSLEWRHLTTQGDPYTQSLLQELLEKPGEAVPVSRDWVDGSRRRGIWLQGWRFRRWEPMPLGVDNTGRIAVLRPLHQYQVSYVDGWGNTVLDSVTPERGDRSGPGWAFMPYVPHTTSPLGRFCDNCHQSRVAPGLGIGMELTEDTRLTVASPPAPIGKMRLLNEKERRSLLEPSKRFRKKRLEALTGVSSRQ